MSQKQCQPQVKLHSEVNMLKSQVARNKTKLKVMHLIDL
uniref:Uncharacterized protein n=2 Tax=Anguilla anguilla TaxID=7936 RepID=A0A0E9QM71_ANGAN